MNDAQQQGPSSAAGAAPSSLPDGDDDDDEEENYRLHAQLQGAAAMNDAPSFGGGGNPTSAVVDGNDSNIDSDDDVPMGLWGL